MPNESNATLAVPNDILKPIIEAHVAKAITDALGGQARLIEEAVRQALNGKVDSSNGQPDRYNSNSSPTFLQWLVDKSIRDAATAAVREHLARDMEMLKASVAKEMKNQKSPLTKSLIEGIAKSAADAGRWQIAVTVKERS